MELCNGNCGLICDDSDEEADSSPTNSPVPPRRVVPSPPLPPRRPSPSPIPNNHLRNGRHLTVPKENAPPPPSSTVILNYADTQQNNKGTVPRCVQLMHFQHNSIMTKEYKNLCDDMIIHKERNKIDIANKLGNLNLTAIYIYKIRINRRREI
jgi:hypothetical protein